MMGGFNEVVTALRALADAPKITLKRSEKKIAAMIDRQFDEGKDPYGTPWEELAESTIAKGRANPPLTDTGAMRASVSVTASDKTITVAVDDPFPYHQAGTGRMPARPILPFAETPPEWEKAIGATAEEVIKTFPVYAALRK